MINKREKKIIKINKRVKKVFSNNFRLVIIPVMIKAGCKLIVGDNKKNIKKIMAM
jgi:hypothetical protein